MRALSVCGRWRLPAAALGIDLNYSMARLSVVPITNKDTAWILICHHSHRWLTVLRFWPLEPKLLRFYHRRRRDVSQKLHVTFAPLHQVPFFASILYFYLIPQAARITTVVSLATSANPYHSLEKAVHRERKPMESKRCIPI